MENKVLKPKIRFKGFTDTWEQRKVGEFGELITGTTPSTSDVNNYNGDYLFVSPADIQGNRFVKNTITTLSEKGFCKCRRLKADSVLFVSIGSTIGKVAQIKEIAVTNQQINAIIPNEKYNPNFVYSLLENKAEDIKKQASAQAVPIINKTTFGEIECFVTTSKEEQTKISKILLNIDNLITLHQSKYDKLVNVKKALLEKMFPKDGKNVPEIRFKGFTDTWEQRKLGKIANIIGGGTPSTLVSKYWNGDINWYSPVEIGDKIFVSSSQKKITQLGYEKSSAKLLPIGTVLFTSRAGIGNTAILAKEGCTNQGFQSIVPNKKEIDSYFIYSMTNQLKEYGEKIGAGSTFAEVSGKQMEEMPINIPKLEEQCKISQLFEKIDNLITLHQHKLEKLKNMKKSLLNKMFI